MRKILFRGKSIVLNIWIYGHLKIDKYGYAYINSEYVLNKYTRIYANTVSQYVGFEDDEGEMIFEGDIIQTPYRKFKVTYKDGVYGDSNGIPMRSSIFGEGGVVIGNIFDNPELLQGE